MLLQENFTYIKDLYNSNDMNEDINEILRGEISATEAYIKIMEALKQSEEINRLQQFKLDHENAVFFWKRQSRISGHAPQKDSGIWGTTVDLFVKASTIIGQKAALHTMLSGEEMGLGTYENMLNSEKLTPYQKKEIERTFIPRQKRHIKSIIELMQFE